MSVGSLCSWLPLVRVSLHCPLDWVQEYVGNTPLSLSVRRFPEKFVTKRPILNVSLFVYSFIYSFVILISLVWVSCLYVCLHIMCMPHVQGDRRPFWVWAPLWIKREGKLSTSVRLCSLAVDTMRPATRLLFPRLQLQPLCFLCHFFPATVGETLQLRAERNLERSSIKYFDTATRK